MAWNTHRHVEAWYGIMGLGAICHTLNPRLFQADLEYIINHAEDCVLLYDTTFIPLVDAVRSGLALPRLPFPEQLSLWLLRALLGLRTSPLLLWMPVCALKCSIEFEVQA